jgi:hypothetical protein
VLWTIWCTGKTTTDGPKQIELEWFNMKKMHLDKKRRGDDFIDFINDDLVALDELEIPRQRKSMDKVKNWYGNKLLELCSLGKNTQYRFVLSQFQIQNKAIVFLTNNNLNKEYLYKGKNQTHYFLCYYYHYIHYNY